MSLPASAVKQRKNVVLYAQNGSSFSPASGTSVIRLQIPNNTEILKNGSLNMTGQLQVRTSSDVAPSVSEDIAFNNFAGIQSCIDSVSIYSLKHNILLEHIKNYGRYVANRVGVLNGRQKLVSGLSNSIGCALSYDSPRITSQVDSRFALEIMSGLLHATESFTMEEVGGLVLELNLSSSPSFIFDQDGSVGTCTYSLTNVKFSAIMFEPTPEWKVERVSDYMSNGSVTVKYDSADIRLNQLQSNADSINDVVNFKKLKALHCTLMLASEQNSQSYDSFEQSVKDVTECSLSINGLKAPYKFSIQGASGSNKAMLARAYLESVSHSQRPDYDHIKTILDPDMYSDSSDETQLFGLGYLFSEDGVKAVNTNLNLNVVSDISAQTVCFMQYDHVKTLTIRPDFVNVSA